MKPTREYHYRGQIERGPRYDWREGWSAYADEGARRGVLYPWMTRRECQRDARKVGRVAVFLRDGVKA